MKILITGSEGKIGKELSKILSEHILMCLDKKDNSPTQINLALDNLSPIIDFNPEIVIHLAASFERTDETPTFHMINHEDNILASYRLCQIISKLNSIKQVIFASSYLVYDPMLYLSEQPIKIIKELSEVDELSPRNLIGASKLYVENELNFIKRNIHSSMMVTHARIFRVFGEGGQEFVSRIIEWKQMGIPVDIWKPENQFDYIHTSDCAQALKSLIGHDGIFNVGYGISTRIYDIIDTIKPKLRVFKKDDLYEASCADITKIQETTKWIPKINVLDWIRRKI